MLKSLKNLILGGYADQDNSIEELLSMPSHKPKEFVRPFVQKLLAALREGRWEVTWEQDRSFMVSPYGTIMFEAKPVGATKNYPWVRCHWHPEQQFMYVSLHKEPLNGDSFHREKTSIDLMTEEKKAIQDYLVSTLPENYKNAPTARLLEEQIKEFESCL